MPRSVSLRHHTVLVLLLATLTLVASACTVSRNPLTGNRRAYAYSWEEEVQLGREVDQQIQAQYGIYDSPELDQYVSRIGQQVLQESHLREQAEEDLPAEFTQTDFTFRVLDSPVVNAFALPGGFVYVTRGLLSHLQNEAQLAVVLGHEVVHVAGRHSSKRALNQQLGQIGLIAGAVAGQAAGLPGGDILQLGSQAAQLLFLSYGREDERESDRFGVEYAALAGYEASEGAAFFRSLERIQEAAGGGIPSFLSTHPDPGEREAFIVQRGREWEERVPGPAEVNQEAYMENIEGMILGEDPRQGFTENGVFYHPELRFRFPYPSGFEVINQPTQVAMVEADGQAIILFSLDENSSPSAAANAFAQSQGLQVLETERTRINGLDAAYVLADANTEQGTVRALATFIELGGQVYRFLAYSAQSTFSQYRRAFENTIQGFGRLTDPTYLNAEPTRLSVVRADRSAPFESFLRGRPIPPGMTEEGLAIMNQVRLDEIIEEGRPLKLPVR